MWIVPLPTHVILPSGTRFSLNLNIYRNAHHYILNQAKVAFTEQVTPLLGSIPQLNHCSIKYTLFTPTKRLCDVANVCSIVDKFFCDTLVKAKVIPEDNYLIVNSVQYCFGGVDKDNPRVEALILY